MIGEWVVLFGVVHGWADTLSAQSSAARVSTESSVDDRDQSGSVARDDAIAHDAVVASVKVVRAHLLLGHVTSNEDRVVAGSWTGDDCH